MKWKCFRCKKFGHVKNLCPGNKGTVAQMESRESTEERCEEENEEEINTDLFNLNNISSLTSSHKILLKVNSKNVQFEIVTGACKSVMSLDKFKEILNVSLKPVQYKLNVVSGQNIETVGECIVHLQHGAKNCKVPLTVIVSKSFYTIVRQKLA